MARTVFAVPYAVLRFGMEGLGGPGDFRRAELHDETRLSKGTRKGDHEK